MSRFVRPSLVLDLRELVRRGRRGLIVSLGIAVGGHLGLTQMRGVEAERRAAKPLTTQFVKRSPRLAKPLELKKRPRPKRRSLKRQMVAVKARGDLRRSPVGFGTPRMMESLSRPSSAVVRSAALGNVVAEPAAVAQAVEGARETKNALDTTVEMLDVNALDTGQYHAMVIQDPRDRRNVRGFFHLHPAYSVSMRHKSFHSIDGRTLRALVNLALAMNKYTNIRVDLAPAVQFDSRELFNTPWVYTTTHEATKGFTITASESSNLGTYLVSGGFILTEPVSVQGPRVIGTPWEVALRQMLKDALASQNAVHGRDWSFEPLPSTHPIYHCFFDFEGAPPSLEAWPVVVPHYLEGITLDDRLVAIASSKAYFYPWSQRLNEYMMDPTRPLQFGVNMLVFVLTQEGSITQQVMYSVD